MRFVLPFLILSLPGGMVNAAEIGKPVPVTSPGTWITPEDYPHSEMALGSEGITAFTLVVDENGAVMDCRIMASSGSTVLDATACALLKVRGRFEPARDAKGTKIASFYSSRVRWVMPVGAKGLPVGKQTMALSVDVDAEGKVETCTPMETPKDFPLSSACFPYPAGRDMPKYLGEDGKGIAYRVVITMSQDVQAR